MSSPPTKYARQADFTTFSTVHPEDQQPGVDLDNELNAVKATSDATIDRLALIQRADGPLFNGIVSPDSLSSSVLAMIALIGGGLPRGNWTTLIVYAVKDIVTQGGNTYIAATAHTAGVFATDLAAGKWVALTIVPAVPFAHVASITELKALDITTLNDSTVISVLGHTTAGDGGERMMRQVNGATDTDDGGWIIQPNAGAARFKIIAPKDAVLVEQFGGSTGIADNAAAFKKAIIAARNWNVKKLAWGGMLPFTSRITQNVSGVGGDDFSVPNGMEFEGRSPFAPTSTAPAVEAGVTWNGAGAWWDQRNAIGVQFVGNWKFRNLKFNAGLNNNDMFHFGIANLAGAAYTPDNTGANPCFTKNVAFHNCYLLGAHGPGDGIQACKVFEFYTDPQTFGTNWRRAIWLKGCDQGKIYGRWDANGRGVMIERSGTFGNNNRITVEQMASSDVNSTSETKYFIYDTGEATKIDVGQLEDIASPPVQAYLYLGGTHPEIYTPHFNSSAAPMFELAPAFLDGTMIAPMCPIGGVGAPIISAAASYDFGLAGADYRMRVWRAPRNFIEACGNNPRIIFEGAEEGTVARRRSRDGLHGNMSVTGGRRAHIYMDAGNYWGSFNGTNIAFAGGISTMAVDTSFMGGWRMEMGNNTGHAVKLICGQDFFSGDWIRWCIHGRHSAAHTATADYNIRKNGGASIASGSVSNNTTNFNNWIDFQASGFAIGDELQLIFSCGTNQVYFLGSHEVFMSESRIVDFTPAAVYANLAAAQADVALLATHVNAFMGLTRSKA